MLLGAIADDFTGATDLCSMLVRGGMRPFGAPYLPVPASALPLPVRYHIHYGEPIHVDHLPVADADDPDVVADLAARVRDALEELIERGLTARRGLFR